MNKLESFLIRIELEKPKDPEHYDILHKAMDKQGFKKTIIGVLTRKSIEYDLPKAMYTTKSRLETMEILNKAKIAAIATKLKFHIVVSGRGTTAWYGLSKTNKKK